MVQKKGTTLNRILESTSPMKVVVPIAIGLAVVFYMLYDTFDLEEFSRLSWNERTVGFLSLTIVIYILRHIAYSWRLRILSKSFFSWKKCIELIFIWEFASSISPTSLGGSATALIFLSQERLATAKVVTIILYSVVLDTLYFLLSFIALLLFLGSGFIFPMVESIFSLNGYVFSFWLVFIIMVVYGSFFYYGLFINPRKISNILRWIAKRKWLKRFRDSIEKTAEDVIMSSTELQNETIGFHLRAIVSTSIAWIFKFATLPLIVFAIIQTVDLTIFNTFNMTGRNQSMFALTAFSPTPGSSGVTEVAFSAFFKDYFIGMASTIIAVIWRLITYYTYLIAGIIVLPIWLRNILRDRKERKNINESSEID